MTLNLVSFFYTVIGDGMTVYVDGVLFLNLAFDFLLLLTTAVVLKRNVKISVVAVPGKQMGKAISKKLYLGERYLWNWI